MRRRRVLSFISAALICAGLAASSLTVAAAGEEPAGQAAAASRRTAGNTLLSGVPLSRPGTERGMGKTAGYECTSGLPATKDGQDYLVVAGHCGQLGETVFSAWTGQSRERVGKVTGASAKYDIAAVRTSRPVVSRVWAVRTGELPKTIRITGVADAEPGTTVCQHGYRSGTVCGITVQPITEKQVAAGRVYGKAPSDQDGARPGDSGGLVIDKQGRAVGILAESTPDGEWVGWVPARLALETWGLEFKQ